MSIPPRCSLLSANYRQTNNLNDIRGLGARGTTTIVWVVTDPEWLQSLPQDIAEHDIEMQLVWLLTTCFQAPSIVGKSYKRTWPSEAGNTLHTAASSYSRIFQKVCVDLINLSQLLLNYLRTPLQVAVDHLDRFSW